MTALETSDYFETIIPTGLTIISCIWLLITYFRLQRKTVGMSMIMVLSLSDIIYATIVLGGTLFPQLLVTRTYFIIFFYSAYFSIFFASVMSLLVYQSLKNKNFEPKKFFAVSLLLVLMLSTIFVWIWQTETEITTEVLLAILCGPPCLSLLITTIFYQLSANILKNLPHAESQLTRIYIKNLQLYSFAQLFTFGPLLLFNFILGVIDIGEHETPLILSFSIGALANMSGFINAVIFFFQRRSASKSSKSSFASHSNTVGPAYMDSDLDTTLMNDL